MTAESKEDVPGDEADLFRMAAEMASPAFTEQLTEWRGERDDMRTTVGELWKGGTAFKSWWSQLSESVRGALLVTCLEDVTDNHLMAPLASVVSPEIMDMQPLLDRDGEKLLTLLGIIVISKENSPQVTSF